MFIARISRGRTLREFILGVMVVPTALALLWIGILGGNAIHLELNAAGGVGTAGIIKLMQDANYEAALYVTIDLLSDIDWLTWAMSALATLLRATWFITSSDVITTLLSMGDPPPPGVFASSGDSGWEWWLPCCCSPTGSRPCKPPLWPPPCP